MTNRSIHISCGLNPIDHTFRFTNAFDKPSFIVRLFTGPNTKYYGLCGGMCFAVLDYFYAKIPISQQTSVPEQASPLRKYLQKRQKTTLSLGNTIFRIILWMLRKDQKIARITAYRELPKIRKSLQRGEAVPVVLIREKQLKKITGNHQVLVTAMDYESDKELTTLTVYDPNHPSVQTPVQILVEHHSMEGKITIHQTTGEPLRGFYQISYHPHKPPAISGIAT